MLMATAGGCSFRRAERGCSDRVYKLPVEWMIGWCTRKYNLVFLGQQLQQVPRRQRMAPGPGRLRSNSDKAREAAALVVT